jgi:hypothetical protein
MVSWAGGDVGGGDVGWGMGDGMGDEGFVMTAVAESDLGGVGFSWHEVFLHLQHDRNI